MSDTVREDVEEIKELQAEVAGLLLHHVYAPLVDDQHVRGSYRHRRQPQQSA